MENVILQEEFKQLVQQQLTAKEWRAADLARAMGKSRQYVSDYLSGRVSPGPDVMERFFEALGCRVHLTLEEVPSKRQAS